MDLGWLIVGLAAIAFFTLPDSPLASIIPWSDYPSLLPEGGNMGPATDYDSIIAREANPPPNTLSFDEFVRLIKSVIQIESGWNPSAVSSAGAIGLMQVMPANATAYGFSPQDLYNPEINIKLGVDILRTEINRFGLRDGLAAYNGGPSKRSLPVTQAYASKVLSVYDSMIA